MDVYFMSKPLGFKFKSHSFEISAIQEVGCVTEKGLDVQAGLAGGGFPRAFQRNDSQRYLELLGI